MRNKVQQSTEERRAAIAKEIEAITVDLERVRSLVGHESEPATTDGPHHTQHVRVPASSRTVSRIG